MKNAQTTQDSPSNDIILDSCTKRLHTGFLGASRRCKLFQLHLGYFFSDAMFTSMVCLAAGHRKFFPMRIENTCIAGNCFNVRWVHQLTSIGTSGSVQCFMHGTYTLINNWTLMVSKYGQRNICPSIRNLQ